MLLSLALIFICSMSLGAIFDKLKFPRLLGMLITGIILGPFALNCINNSILEISADLRQIALIIILTRAGLNLDISDLKKVGLPAVLMCFVPACFEIGAMVIFAPMILKISVLEAAILGTVIAAVSPAVIVPKMLKLIDEGYGTKKSIPQLIMAGASVDDVFVIVLFAVFTSLAQGESISAMSFVEIPVSIVLGAIGGIIVGLLLSVLFEKIHIRDSSKVIIMLSCSFLLITFESFLKGTVGFSGLLAVMSMGICLQKKKGVVAKRISLKYSKLWVCAELLLFVLVGATVDINYALASGVNAILIIFIVLAFRMVGVFVSILKANFTKKERLFCMLGYMPKATVQAAIGSIPLSMGLACGNIVLTVAVLAIIITAPLGAFLIDLTYKKLLNK